ncbi:hypothetical protein Ddye_031625 [Dipteronia dyeriana]|uniref:Uncharacterized protein n=1 Tax=Dipteronia dyeriana TaxID=168575 RepID=A0AAD9TJN8_9ROSI|nr:hypothetical protein Ddye_031625 [Dipteronia dyeriana]
MSSSPRDIKMILQKFPEHQFSKLKSLAVFNDESTVFPFGMIQRFYNLKKLELTDKLQQLDYSNASFSIFPKSKTSRSIGVQWINKLTISSSTAKSLRKSSMLTLWVGLVGFEPEEGVVDGFGFGFEGLGLVIENLRWMAVGFDFGDGAGIIVH